MSGLHALLVRAGMASYGWRFWRPLDAAAGAPRAAQEATLHRLLTANADTEFGRAHGFASIRSHAEYAARVPIQTYESLRPFVEAQRTRGVPALTAEPPQLYARTSGSTGTPKYVPITASLLDLHRVEQKIFSYLQHRACPAAFAGRPLGIMGAAVEGRLDSGHVVGSVSGHLYRSMPRPVKARFVVPPDVSSVDDYELKYLLILRLALASEDITYLGTPNPSTFLRLAGLMATHRDALTRDVADGGFARVDELPAAARDAVQGRLAPNPARAAALDRLPALTFASAWPRIALVTTWTGGSCGIALGAVRALLPPATQVMELGYQATEFRGTLALTPETSGGLVPLHHTVLEFVDENDWREGHPDARLVDALETGRRYQVVVTTAGGLYRYAMNDLVEVAGRYRNAPLLRFVQKGRGVTNLTGEKLYEAQVIAAVDGAAAAAGVRPVFFLMVADEAAQRYTLFVELAAGSRPDPASFAAAVDCGLAARNVEYEAKRASGRLPAAAVVWARSGSGERYKAACVRAGQREGQYKPVVLVYTRDLKLPPDALREPEGQPVTAS